MTIYRVYWTDESGWHEDEYPSLTEATIRKAELKRQGIVGRIVPIRTVVG